MPVVPSDHGCVPSLEPVSPGAGLPVSSPLVRSRPCGAGLLPATSRAGQRPASCAGEAGVAPRGAERHGHALASAPPGHVGHQREGGQVARDRRTRPAEKALNFLDFTWELLTPDDHVDIMSTHENHQANTSQGLLDAIPAG